MAFDYKETKKREKATDRVQQVEDFLKEHYDVKINVFDASKTLIVAKNKDLYKSEIKFVDLSLHMEREGLRGCDSTLKKILASQNQITTFNPITEYLEGLKGQWKGVSHIDKLCNHIEVRDFGDKTKTYYPDRLRYVLRKYLAACVANSLNQIPNEAMLGFICAKEGIGKTRLIKFLTPKLLKPYYIQSSKDDRFDMTAAFAQNFFINFDELWGITKHNSEQVKQTTSANEYHLSRRDTNAVPRYGNGVFTSNKSQEMGGFLHPQMGHRRWAAIELESINWKAYSVEVDVDQIWAEAYVLFNNADFDFTWNETDFAEFEEYNTRYLVETHAYRLIKENYRVPTAEDDPEKIAFKQPQEMLMELRSRRKITTAMSDVSDVTIGLALKALGFTREMKKVNKILPRYGYNVISLFE
ncbi:MAG TPA: VapE domain-containing protein [Paludibacter sp.]